MNPESADTLATLSPVALKALLEDEHWEFSSSPRPNVELWARNGHEIILPLNARAPDYSKRIRNFIEDLAHERGASQEDVARELLYIDDDIIDFVVAEVDNSVPLTNATKILEGAKALAIASACSVIKRRSYHGHRRPDKARKFADAVRMGHTRRGSFVIPIISPVHSDRINILDQEQESISLAGESEFFPRRATGMMADTLKVLHDLATTSEEKRPASDLNRAVVDGLSADTCSAMVQMLTSAGDAGLDVSFHWAVASPPRRAGAEQLSFPVEAVPAIDAIEEVLRSNIEVDDTVLYGFVSSLERDQGEPLGSVKVRTIIDGRTRPVSVTLNESEYHLAAEANDLRIRVIVAGSLMKLRNGTLAMREVDSFRMDDYLPFHVSDEWANERNLGET
jgi:hypothetical protein